MIRELDSPLGSLWAEASARGLRRLEFADSADASTMARSTGTLADEEAAGLVLDNLENELAAYFLRQLRRFQVKLDLQGTEFQLRVWGVLLTIPWGETRTYTQQTALLGNPLALRAVASANGRNPVAIVVPCHRVLGADGSLTGYAGGLDRKRALLALEGYRPGGQAELF